MALTDVNLFRIDGDLGSVSNIQTSALNGGPLAGARNRIINGDMRIDQRNAGASVSISDSQDKYPVDRFYGSNRTGTAVFTAQQTSASTPAGFNNSLIITTTTANSSLSALQYAALRHSIEGFNTADLGWGTANATTITLSFWVRSSLTGTFGGSLANAAFNRSYPFTYTISAANTWEKKTVAVAGDTSGTWATDNTAGIHLFFGLGSGTTFSGTAGSWAGAAYYSATGATSVVGTNGATFYITGVQLEAGTVATPFERRSYGQELALCQRYFWQLSSTDKGGYNNGLIYQGWADAATNSIGIVQLPVTMRTSPTILTSGTAGDYVFRAPISQGTSPVCSAVPTLNTSGTQYLRISATTSSTFTVGAGHYFSFKTTAGYIGFSSEL